MKRIAKIKKPVSKVRKNKRFLGMMFLAIFLFSLGFCFISLGFHFSSQPEQFQRKDIASYNQGVKEYLEFKKKLEEFLEFKKEIEESFAFFGKSQKSFNEVILLSSNKELRSLAFYNLGTMTGEVALDKELPLPLEVRIEIVQKAIDLLEKAVREDPENEEAKYNLEFLRKWLEQFLKEMEEKGTIPEEGEEGEEDTIPEIAPGYTPGRGGDRGY